MKVREILELLDRPYCVQLQTINGIICTTITDTEGVDPYLNRELIRWGLTDKMSSRAIADIFFELAPKAESETVLFYNGEIIEVNKQQEEQ